MFHLSVADLPLILATILWLVFLEGLLSADNALVLAMMVRHLPKDQQKRALRYGIWGAFGFRLIAVLLARVLLDFWFLKVVGGLYLLYLALSHVLSREEDDDAARGKRFGSSFWGTVVSVEIADIAFSIDSILAAVAMAEGLPDEIHNDTRFFIVVTGGILGIITMRFVAGYFIKLLERFKGLEAGAYALVAWIGLKLVVGGFYDGKWLPFEINEWVFWPVMLAIVAIGLVYKPKRIPVSVEQENAVADAERLVSHEELLGGEESTYSAPPVPSVNGNGGHDNDPEVEPAAAQRTGDKGSTPE